MNSATRNSSMVARLLAVGTPAARKPRAVKLAAVAAPVDAEAIVLAAVRAAAATAQAGDLLSVATVRAATALDKATFDAAALALQAAGKLVLHYHDAWQWLPAAEVEAMVASGNYRYHGIALRRGA